MALGLSQSCFVVLLLASAAGAQTYYCPFSGGETIDWHPLRYPEIYFQTTERRLSYYTDNMNCYFTVRANIPGRMVVQVSNSDLTAGSASIQFYTESYRDYVSGWSQLTYKADQHTNFVSLRNRLYITFTSGRTAGHSSRGVSFKLSFLQPSGCIPGWTRLSLGGYQHCVGSQSYLETYKFGDAQRHCNRMRSNLLVSDRDSVSSVLARVGGNGAINAWIGMTAEPLGSSSVYRWINNVRVSSSEPVLCTGTCRPGSTTHRCVQAINPSMLSQVECSARLKPLCYMPLGGTDTFYAGSSSLGASGTLLAGAVGLLLWVTHLT